MIKGDRFYYNNKEYRIEKRLATVGDIIISIPELYRRDVLYRSRNEIPFLKPLKVSNSLVGMVFFDYTTEGLSHDEYYVINLINKHKIKTGQNTIVKRFFGIPVWRSTTYEYKYIEQ